MIATGGEALDVNELTEAWMGDSESSIGEALVASINGLSEQVSKQTDSVGLLRERVASQEQSTKSLWHEVRGLSGKIDRRFEELPTTINGAVKAHAEDCIARARARRKATDHDSDQNIPRPPQYARGYAGSPDDSQVVEIQRGPIVTSGGFTVPSKIVWIGVTVGLAIAVAGWLLSAFGVLPGLG